MITDRTFWQMLEMAPTAPGARNPNRDKYFGSISRMIEASERRAEGRRAKGHQPIDPPAPECDWRRLVRKT